MENFNLQMIDGDVLFTRLDFSLFVFLLSAAVFEPRRRRNGSSDRLLRLWTSLCRVRPRPPLPSQIPQPSATGDRLPYQSKRMTHSERLERVIIGASIITHR